MLSPTAKTKRTFETIQVLLTFISFSAVVDATFLQARPHEAAGYAPGRTQSGEARADRLFGDLARTERKRREAAVKEALEQR